MARRVLTEEQRAAARESKRRYREAHREEIRAKNREYAKTRYDNDPKYAEKMRERIRALGRENPEYLAEIRRRSYLANADTRRAERREWYEQNREKALAWAAEYWRGLTAEQKRYVNQLRSERRQANPRYRILATDASQRRRARDAGAETIERVERLVVFARDEGICHICAHHVDPDGFHVDHVVPLARGGQHSYANVRLAHPSCNLRKGQKLLEEM